MPIPRFILQGKASGPHLLILGAVHGDEFEPVFAIHQLRHLLDTAAATGGLLAGTVTLVPVANPSAFDHAKRCGADDLDLARTFPGVANGSITERVAFEVAALIRNADYLIDLHTGGTDMAVTPLTGYMLHPDPAILARQREMAKAFHLPVIWGTTPNLQGRSLSVARDAQIPAIYCEYQGSASCTLEGIQAYVNGCLNVMAAFNMIDRPLPDSNVKWVVEDNQPDSGHMQICNPAPIDGLFQPCVAAGHCVQCGEAVGTLLNTESGESHIMSAPHDGVIIVLRTFPKVRAGQSLFVILQTSTPAD